MSRHEITPKDPRHQVAVGWDRPMNTFFAQVHDNQAADEDDSLVFWIGGDFDQVQAPEGLVAPLAQWADLASDMVERLRADREAAPADRAMVERAARMAALGGGDS